MAWYPAGLDQALIRLADAIDARFQKINPDGPTKIAAYTTAELSAMVPSAPSMALNRTSGKLAVASLNAAGTAYAWRNADGTAL